MLTVGDALISISLGVTLFSEELRVGWWLLPEIVALVAIVAGCIQITKSPLASEAAPLVSAPARRYSNDVNRLGELERAIMEVLWQTESSLTVRQVSNGLTSTKSGTYDRDDCA